MAYYKAGIFTNSLQMMHPGFLGVIWGTSDSHHLTGTALLCSPLFKLPTVIDCIVCEPFPASRARFKLQRSSFLQSGMEYLTMTRFSSPLKEQFISITLPTLLVTYLLDIISIIYI
jgi:hypothetical protein